MKRQWNVPNRTDYYLMGIRADVRATRAKNPRAVRLKHCFIEFDLKPGLKFDRSKWRPGMPRPITKEDIARINRERSVRIASATNPRPNYPGARPRPRGG